jgi:hypothetical protein
MSLGPIISRLFTCSNAEKKQIKRVPALVLSLWVLTVKLSSECRYAECRSAKNRGANLQVSFCETRPSKNKINFFSLFQQKTERGKGGERERELLIV